jgi:hypothetical protein
LPRKFTDHRSQKAKLYRDYYLQVIEQHPPRARLGHWLAGMLAEMMIDFDALRRVKKKGAKAARRKTVGLLFGCLREVRHAASPHGARDDLNAELTRMMETK